MVGFSRLLPEFCIAFLVLLKNEIMLCQSLSALRSTLKHQSVLVTLRDLQKYLEHDVMPTVRSEYSVEQSIAFHEVKFPSLLFV